MKSRDMDADDSHLRDEPMSLTPMTLKPQW